MEPGAELKCQNPAMNVIGKDGIELEGKLQDTSPFAEGLQEAEQNSKNDACQSCVMQLFARDLWNKTLTDFCTGFTTVMGGKQNPNKIWQNILKYCFSL